MASNGCALPFTMLKTEAVNEKYQLCLCQPSTQDECNGMYSTCQHDEDASSFITTFTTNYVTIKCSA
jgi:hypothetical protein